MKNVINHLKSHIWFYLVAVFLLLPVLVYAGNSLPAADDYSNTNAMVLYWQRYSPAVAALVRSIELYDIVGGYYFAAFLNYFFMPFLRWGITGVRVFNVVSNLCFYGGCFYLIKVFTRDILGAGSKMVWFLFCAFLFSLLNNTQNSEMFTWYCVQVAYMLPMALMLFSLGLFLRSAAKGGWGYIPAAVGAFLASASSLNITALNCGMFLILGFYAFLVLGRKKESLITFGAAFLGALVNVAAPGNYARHTSFSATINPVSGLAYSVLASAKLVVDKLFRSPFLAVLVIVAVVTYLCVDFKLGKFKFRFPLLGLCVALAGIVIVNFPVCLGYNGSYLDQRCIFVQDLATYFLLYLWVVYFTGWLKEKYGKIRISPAALLAIGLSCLFYVMSICTSFGLVHLPTARMYASILGGGLSESIAFEQGLVEEIQNSEDKDVVLVRDRYVSDPFVMSIGLTDNREDWVNQAVSVFFGKDSVVLLINEGS